MHLKTILVVLGVVLAAAPLTAIAYAWWKSAVAKASAENWQTEAELQQTRAERLSERVDELTEQVQALAAKITQLEAANEVLTQLATGRAKVDALAEEVRTNHTETTDLLHQLIGQQS